MSVQYNINQPVWAEYRYVLEITKVYAAENCLKRNKESKITKDVTFIFPFIKLTFKNESKGNRIRQRDSNKTSCHSSQLE